MENLEPSVVWKFFGEITQIPRPSKKEEKIREYLLDVAQQYRLEAKTDQAGNVLICKPATFGYENHNKIILQSHMDMVCEKDGDVQHNFESDPIQTFIDGDWIKAKGTTLGADNGIGMAMMLAVLTSDNISHPALECLFTVDEETGLTGASAIEDHFLSGQILINLDSEDDGVIFIGCAGGIDTTINFPFIAEKSPNNYFSFSLTVKGLKGGHSGDDIDKRHGNAIKILNRFLWNVNKKLDLRIHTFRGGNLHNAIPREAEVVASVPFEDKEKLRVLLNEFIAEIEGELKEDEPALQILISSEEIPDQVLDKKSSDKLLNALYACPHGVKAFSRDMPNLVETSTNLASVRMQENNSFLIITSQRSSVESAKFDIAHQVESVFTLAQAQATHGEGYPGWKPNLNSEILQKAKVCYKNITGEEPKVRAIHAGLECGLFLKKYPYLDMISIGPQMYGVHSPNERLSISSTRKCWQWLLKILEKS